MGKGLHNLFETVVKIFQNIYHLWVNMVHKFPISFQNPGSLLKLPDLSDNIKKIWLKATQKDI